MATVDFIAIHSQPTFEFKYTTSLRNYSQMADFFGSLGPRSLVKLGFDRVHVSKMLTRVIAKMYEATYNVTDPTQRFVMPISAVTDIINIVERSQTENPAVLEFKNILASMYPEDTLVASN